MKHGCLSMLATAFSDRMAYASDALLSLISVCAKVFIARILMGALYAGKTEIGGMTLSMVVTYYILVSALYTLDQSEAYTWEFAAEIRGGLFGKYLARPVDPLVWYLSVSGGRSLFRLLMILSAAGILFLFQACSGISLMRPPAPQAVFMLPVFFLALLFLALLNYCTSLLAFVFQDITPFHMVKTELSTFLSGAMIPLAFMPDWARRIVYLTPFPALASLPAELWLGTGGERVPGTILILLLWCLALAACARIMLSALRDRYEEVGA